MGKRLQDYHEYIVEEAIYCLLTLYYMSPSFTDPDKNGFQKHYGKREKMIETSIFSFFFKNVSCLLRDRNRHLTHLPNDKFSDWSKLKVFADDKVHVS